jgi:hypothetical protein
MTIGTGAFYPSGRFTFPRSYIAKVEICTAGFALNQDGNAFEIDFRPTFNTIYHFRFHPNFWPWSSNAWSLDHIITQCYHTSPPSPVQNPLNFGLYWVRYPPDPVPQLQFAPNLSTVNPVKVVFPSYPPSYWARPT